jgi:TROVE domain
MAGKSKSKSSSKSGAKGGSTLKTAMSAQNNAAARIRIPQTIGLPGQIANNAGGYSFPLPLEQEWMRYLIIGSKSDNGSYYQCGGAIATTISKCIMAAVSSPATCAHLIRDIVDVSVSARAPKQEMTMMSLAAAIVFPPDNACKAQALAAINQVCRIPTHLFMLVQYIRDLSQDKAKPGKGFGKGVRRALTEYYTSRGGLELAVLVTKYKNREGWTHEDLISLLHINPAEMKDDGGRLVLEWIMKKDKPERKIAANPARGIVATTLPAKMERTEFLKRLAAIPTPDRDMGGAAAGGSGGFMKTISNAIGSVLGGGGAAASATTQVSSLPRLIQVLFEVVHPESPMSGTLKLMVRDNEPLQNVKQTLTDIGVGTSFVFRYNGSLISSTKSLRDISYDPSKKIYLGAGVEPVVEPIAALPASEPKTAIEVNEEEEKKKTGEDPLVATARFLKALLELAKTGEKKDTATAIALMERNKKIQREHLPTELLNTPQIWNALLSGMGMTALVRNLGKLSQVGVASTRSQDIIKMLTDPKTVKDSRIHPLQVLVGMKTYSQGKGDLGSMTWTVNSYITAALSTTFRQAFGNITPTGKRFMFGLDVSGSMSMCMCAGAKNITPREGSVAMAMMTLHAEGAQNVHIYGFSNVFYNFNGKIRPEMTIQDAIKATDVPFGATDCALPMTEALKMYRQNGIVFDVFCVYTDNETYAPNIHPQVALEQYRKATGVDAKLIVVGMTANQLTIADPKDKNTLNLAGFDTATPELISMFVRGQI